MARKPEINSLLEFLERFKIHNKNNEYRTLTQITYDKSYYGILYESDFDIAVSIKSSSRQFLQEIQKACLGWGLEELSGYFPKRYLPLIFEQFKDLPNIQELIDSLDVQDEADKDESGIKTLEEFGLYEYNFIPYNHQTINNTTQFLVKLNDFLSTLTKEDYFEKIPVELVHFDEVITGIFELDGVTITGEAVINGDFNHYRGAFVMAMMLKNFIDDELDLPYAFNLTFGELRSASDLDEIISTSTSSLIVAIEENNINAVKQLIKDEADINELDNNQHAPLLSACCENNYKVAKLLIKAGADVNKAGIYGNTPLIQACASGSEKLVQLLIKSGANINYQNNEQASPLIICCAEGNYKAAKLLVAAQADINIKIDERSTPLFIATINNHKNIIATILSQTTATDLSMIDLSLSLIVACQQSNIGIAKLLIKAGADVNYICIEDGDEFSPLTLALSNDNFELIKLLVENKADLYQKNSDGQTPLDYAEKIGINIVVDLKG